MNIQFRLNTKSIVSSTASNPSRTIGLLLVVSSCCLLAACSSHRVIKGEAPLVSISYLALRADTLTANFDIRNPNGVEMVIERIEIGIQIKDQKLNRADESFALTIDAGSAEDMEVESHADETTVSLLRQLQDGELLSIPYELDGQIHTRSDGIESFSHEGHLYPVPGRPGYFRGAGANTPREDQRVRYDD